MLSEIRMDFDLNETSIHSPLYCYTRFFDKSTYFDEKKFDLWGYIYGLLISIIENLLIDNDISFIISLRYIVIESPKGRGQVPCFTILIT